MQNEFGRTAQDCLRYRAPFPDSFFDPLAAHGIVCPPGGWATVDLSAGTGALARALAARA